MTLPQHTHTYAHAVTLRRMHTEDCKGNEASMCARVEQRNPRHKNLNGGLRQFNGGTQYFPDIPSTASL